MYKRQLLRSANAHGCATLRSILADPEAHGVDLALAHSFVEAVYELIWEGGTPSRKVELTVLRGPRRARPSALLRVLGPPLAPHVSLAAVRAPTEAARDSNRQEGARSTASEPSLVRDEWTARAWLVHPRRQRAHRADLAAFLVDRQGVLAVPGALSAHELAAELERAADASMALVLEQVAAGVAVFEASRTAQPGAHAGAPPSGRAAPPPTADSAAQPSPAGVPYAQPYDELERRN